MPTPITETIRLGLAYEKGRLEAASYNLAIANTPLQAGSSVKTKTAAMPSAGFADRVGLSLVTESDKSAVKQVYDPTHPYADSQGMVRYPDVDPTHEMATLVAATRGYEANVRAFNAIQQMASKALEIGGRR